MGVRMDPVLVDTAYALALISPRDEHHNRALELSYLFEGASLHVTDGVLLEIGNALSRGFKQNAITLIQKFLVSGNVKVHHVTPELFAAGFELYGKYPDKEWGLVDCISFVVMQREGIKAALTHDKHFVQAGFKALMRD